MFFKKLTSLLDLSSREHINEQEKQEIMADYCIYIFPTFQCELSNGDIMMGAATS